jgi:hypothetical protein
MSSGTSHARKTESGRIKHTEETVWPAMPLSVWPAVFANGCDIKRILPGDECPLSGTEMRFYRTVLCPATVLARIGAGQHPFHRWAEKSKISIVCFSGHVEVVKFCMNHCCKFVSNAVSRIPSPRFQKKFTRVEI